MLTSSWRTQPKWLIPPPLTLGEMRLAPIRPRYAAPLFRIVNTDRDYLRCWQNWPDTIRTLGDMRDLISMSLSKARNYQGYDLVIYHREQIAGKIGLVYIDWENHRAEIGYWLGKAFQGQGLMTRATWLVTGHAFTALDLLTVQIRCAAENVRSRAIPERLGFAYQGVMPQKIWIHGELFDDTLYTMSAEDWYGHMIYHITTTSAWETALRAKCYRAESLDKQGFIHASNQEQVVKVANAIYAGQDDLVLLCIDPMRLNAPLKVEPPDTNVPAAHYDGELFPHIYGEINLAAVVQVIPFPPNSDGTFDLPATFGTQTSN